MNLTRLIPPNNNPYAIFPREFLNWARLDLSVNDKRSIGNAIGNIKRAIHCRIDEIIGHTHIRDCKGWNQRASTRTKLDVLKELGIKYSSVADLLTDIRNIYEHSYKIIDYKKVGAYLEVAEMWLNISYQDYSFGKLAIKGIQPSTFEIVHNEKGCTLKEIQFLKSFDFDYIWDSRKEIHEVKKGNLTKKLMKDIDWETMLKYEAKHVVFSNTPNSAVYSLPASILTNIYKKALNHLTVSIQ